MFKKALLDCAKNENVAVLTEDGVLICPLSFFRPHPRYISHRPILNLFNTIQIVQKLIQYNTKFNDTP